MKYLALVVSSAKFIVMLSSPVFEANVDGGNQKIDGFTRDIYVT